MGKILHAIAGWKLNKKFTLIIFLIVFIPVMALTSILFSTTRQTLIREKIGNIRLDMEQMHARDPKNSGCVSDHHPGIFPATPACYRICAASRAAIPSK